ncbi:alpha/beta hydrolase [Shimia sp. R10_1]|uniref:alpha/beta hydrolase n=1 Tax=Shimia sp. R10_1 TaxID=2821095 RepID=UPI001ADBFC74|nr:alpha/beta hydrolase [Shimia sp. R10_1]MBO9472533.1 alpha/beta hydrolase [Shimia sp. R10_1]
MGLQRAPFYHDVAEGPEADAYWITADDGVRLRLAHWRHDTDTGPSKGTVLLFPGRTEYVEKYGRAAADFGARGYEMVAIDWRGQGLADRLIKNPGAGYVGHFDDFQRDVRAVMGALETLPLPQPFHLIGHSMGGCIGLRALYDGLPVASVVFSGPMWGIHLSPIMRPAAWTLSYLSKNIGFDEMLAPGTSATTYVLDQEFTDNALTKDPDMYAYMQRQMTDHPDLSLAGPSLRWVHEALMECRRLEGRPSPDTPCLTFLGADEQIVDTSAIHDRMARWPNGTLDLVDAGEHEVLMEVPGTRNRIFDDCAAFFAEHS